MMHRSNFPFKSALPYAVWAEDKINTVLQWIYSLSMPSHTNPEVSKQNQGVVREERWISLHLKVLQADFGILVITVVSVLRSLCFKIQICIQLLFVTV